MVNIGEHWHIDRSMDEDAESAFPDVFAALDAISTDVHDRADFAYQGISALGDAGCYEDAYRSFQDWESLSAIEGGIANLIRNHGIPATSPDRAPLFRSSLAGPGQDQALWLSAVLMTGRLSSETPFTVWACCKDDVVKVTDDNTDIGGNLLEDGVPYYG